MPGIVAAHGPFDPQIRQRMLNRLAPRGPDGEGTRTVGDAWLGHRPWGSSTSKADTSRSATPPKSCGWSGTAIYNHDRIRTQLDDREFVTQSDHEAALHVYEDRGIDGFDDLWGTFALVIAADDGRFVATRDTIGVAPLCPRPGRSRGRTGRRSGF